MVEKVVKLGIIGGGMMSQVGHLPFFLSDPRCEVIAVAENRASLIPALSMRLGEVGRVVADHFEILEDPEVDAVVISTPRGATAPMVEQALKAGKHVLSEKPMALTSEDADRLVALAAEKGLIYAVGYMKRYDPGIQIGRDLLFEFLKSGRLGALIAARFFDYSKNYAITPPSHVRPIESRTERFPVSDTAPAWLPQKFRPDWEWFLNAGSHDLNLINFFFPENLETVSASHPGPDAVVAILRCRNVAITLEVIKSAIGTWREGVEFLFENACLTLEIPSPMAVDRVTRVKLEENIRGSKVTIFDAGSGWSFARQAAGFVNALLGGAPPATTGLDGLRDMRLNDAIWKCIVHTNA